TGVRPPRHPPVHAARLLGTEANRPSALTAPGSSLNFASVVNPTRYSRPIPIERSSPWSGGSRGKEGMMRTDGETTKTGRGVSTTRRRRLFAWLLPFTFVAVAGGGSPPPHHTLP